MSENLTKGPIGSSRIYRAGIDEEYYQSNLLHRLIRDWIWTAHKEATDAVECMRRCRIATEAEDQHYWAYFAGVSARRAFSIAARLLALDEERQRYLQNEPMDWSKL